MAQMKDTIIEGFLALRNSNGIEINDVQEEIIAQKDSIKDHETRIFSLENMHFIPFTLIRNTTNQQITTGSTSCVLFTLAEIRKNYFSNANEKNCGAFIMNGDGKACSAHFDGVTWMNNILYGVFNRALMSSETQIRVTGFLYYISVDLITN